MDSGAAETGGDAGRRRYESPLRQEQQLATRERILEALAGVLTDGGAATVPAVAERAGVSERTVYRHFPTRDDLFASLFAWVMRLDPQERPAAEDVEGIAGLVRDMFPRFERRAEVIRAMNYNPVGLEMRRKRAGYRRQGVNEALATALEGVDPDARERVEVMVHLVTSSTAYLHLSDYWGMTAADAAEVVAWAVRALVRAAREEQEEGDDGGQPAARVGRARARKLGG